VAATGRFSLSPRVTAMTAFCGSAFAFALGPPPRFAFRLPPFDRHEHDDVVIVVRRRSKTARRETAPGPAKERISTV